MNVRTATVDDGPALVDVARASLAASYGDFLDEATIDDVSAEWYADDRLADLLAGDAEEYEELVFETALGEGPVEGVVEAIEGPEGTELFVDYGESERSGKAPLFAVYEDGDLTVRYGFRCGNCGSLDVAMDAMGRIPCENCGNRRKATRWDAASL